MRILGSPHDFRDPIRTMADSPGPLIAHKGRMLLELIEFLEARGPAPSVFAWFFGEELTLHPANRHNPGRVRITLAGARDDSASQ